MDCEKVRDRFSSLWEKELTISEEKSVREHLSSCPECQREFERFEKTMRWLGSMEEAEVPEGFLPELLKKMEERGRAPLGKKTRGKWYRFPLSFKLPVQAVAMVAIVFLVLYLTKMMPVEFYRSKDTRQTAPPLSMERKPEQILTQIEMEKDQRILKTTPEKHRPKDVDLAQAPVLKEEKLEGTYAPPAKSEAKKEVAPPPQAEMTAYPQMESKETAGARAPSPGAGKIEKGLVAKEKSFMGSKLPKEITLKISDREKVIPQLLELIKQFGGEMIAAEGNMFLASLPTTSFSEFEKGLSGLSASTQADKVVVKKPVAESLRTAPSLKREGADEKGRAPTKLEADQENRTFIRILLVPE
jgi:hypothetical protein